VMDEEPGGAAAGGLAGQADVEEALRAGAPAVSGLVPGPPARLLLLVPFRDWRGQIAGLLGGVIDPGGPEWRPLPGAAARDQRAALVDSAGAVLVRTDGAGPAPPPGASVAALSAAPWRVLVWPAEEAGASAVLRRRLLVAAPALLSMALLFAWGAAGSLTRPLQALGQAAGRIAGGDLSRPVPLLGEDEVGSLGRSLEAMRAALAESVEALRRERNELERRVAERTRELEALYRKTLAVQEEERKRIARELHDETCQALVALALRFDPALAAATLDGVHRLIFDLRPSVLDDLGLVPAIRWLAARLLEPVGVAVRCELEELGGRLAPEMETALFRATQEALANVRRHAQAEAVLIQLYLGGGALRIEIEDDGRGFDPAAVAGPEASGRGLGLLGIRERLELLGGLALIDSSPGHGTRVTLQVPWPEAGGA
jgi:signal transduction histidine kinase